LAEVAVRLPDIIMKLYLCNTCSIGALLTWIATSVTYVGVLQKKKSFGRELVILALVKGSKLNMSTAEDSTT
jgi:hypothetical protein